MTDGSPIGSRGVSVVVLAAIVSIVTLLGLPEGFVAYDFVEVYVPAGERVLDGEPLYPDRDDPVVSDNRAYVYPPATALLAAPLSGLSDLTLEIVGVLGSFAALFGALWLLHVRDIRCYAVVALWLPTVLAWQNANLSVIVTLACALVWRFRDSAPKAGAALGLGIALKVLLWPLVGWLVATKRLSAAALAIVVSAGAVLISWAVIGFDGLASYQGLVSRLTEIETRDPRAISVYAAAL